MIEWRYYDWVGRGKNRNNLVDMDRPRVEDSVNKGQQNRGVEAVESF